MKIAFICTGNTCRSSMAEAMAIKWLAANAPGRKDIEITSAGLAAVHGSPASPQSVEVMKLTGIDLTGHRARQLTVDLVEQSDLILTMTEAHKHIIADIYPDVAAAKLFTLAEFAGGGADISDPFARPVEVYRRCAGEIERFLNQALQKIVQADR